MTSGALLATNQHRNTKSDSPSIHWGIYIGDDAISCLRSGQPLDDDVILLPVDSCPISLRVSEHPVRQRRPSEDVQLYLGQVQVYVQTGFCGTVLSVHAGASSDS